MEFYPSSFLTCLGQNLCFNSQRDGILPFQAVRNILLGLVSIPNGMEFYSLKRLPISQISLFQFPTGWNSTIGSLENPAGIWVSIPNGMEFYRIRKRRPFSISSFNSQRDGILQDSVSLFKDSRKFQFPTGWNSTMSSFT